LERVMMAVMDIEMARRPLKTRQRGWARGLAAGLSEAGVSPNAVSLLSLGFAAAAAVCLLLVGSSAGRERSALLIAAAAGVQLRLLCNLLDGLIAVEGGKRTAAGELFNEVPDRFADVLLLVAAGWAAGTPAVGWAAAVLAVLTAYVRVLGGSLGFAQSFAGPMAKPHRMAVLTGACLLSCFEPSAGLLVLGLWLILLGSAVTVVRRLVVIVRLLRER
jgi:phosphatidylglycerophosphate synthase